MSDFLDRLVSPTLTAPLTVRPLIPSRFEAASTGRDPFGAKDNSEPIDADLTSTVEAQQPIAGPVQQPLNHVDPQPSVGFDTPRAEPPVLPVPGPGPAHRLVPPATERFINDEPLSPGDFSAGSGGSEWIERRLEDLSTQLRQLRVGPKTDRLAEHRPPLLHSASEPPQSHGLPVPTSIEHESAEATAATSPEVHAFESGRDSRIAPIDRWQSVDQPTPSLPVEPQLHDREDARDIQPPSAMPPRLVPESLPSSRGQAEPTINVTIGRVEVKAIRDTAPAPQPSRPQPRTAVMSLQDYLKRRAGGGI